MKEARLFTSAFIQVFLISVNVVLISNKVYIGIAVVGFAISWTWASNVKKISVGSTIERFTYASGAATGNISGVLFSDTLLKLLS